MLTGELEIVLTGGLEMVPTGGLEMVLTGGLEMVLTGGLEMVHALEGTCFALLFSSVDGFFSVYGDPLLLCRPESLFC